ncbi:MAG: 4-alpha-glucanotransferase [Cyanobacteriota bacterium]
MTRSSGVLLHPTALPHSEGSGTFGLEARQWVEALARHGVSVWQTLPLAPTDAGGSPYSSPSGFALNPCLLDPDDLVADGLLLAEDLAALPPARRDVLDLEACRERITVLAERLRRRWPQARARHGAAFEQFRRQQSDWLEDHCLFMVLRRLEAGRPWWQWPLPLAQRQPKALRRLREDQGEALLEEALLQWTLQLQWQRLHDHAAALGVRLLGDLPFYVAHDSVDVWSHPRLFSLGPAGSLKQQSGVPPDYFAATGQLWGTPVYRWFWHRLSGFRWWLRRLERQLELVDVLRLDHFRALSAYWSVPGKDPTAEHGQWRRSPGRALLGALRRQLARQAGRPLSEQPLPLIAEDLGVITPDVEALRDDYHLSGMKVLQFAFDGDRTNPYLPANIEGPDWVVYTGTHDNATTVGWWQGLDHEGRERVAAAIGGPVNAPAWQLLELGLASPAALVVVPLQDLLELDDRARFNTPGTAEGNWSWRLQQSVASLEGPLLGFGEMASRYGRGPIRN